MTHPTDDEIIKRCKAAGIRWLPPAPDAGEGDFPGAFDLVTMVEMRALLATQGEPVAWALGNPRYVHATNIFPAHEFTPDAERADEWTALYDHPAPSALLAEQARTEPTGGFARLAPNALPVGTLYPAIYPAKAATQPLKAEQAKDAAEDAPKERTPQDYAIEHAEYMAVDGEHLIAAIDDFGKALQEVDDGTANPSDVDAARETLREALGAMRSGIYEFRKRRDRAARAAERKA